MSKKNKVRETSPYVKNHKTVYFVLKTRKTIFCNEPSSQTTHCFTKYKIDIFKKLIQLNCAAKLPIFLLNKLFFRNTFEINIFKTQ